uniref:PPIase cyclophilin-type domain-containing protein n=1 Tax=Neobodo designis TaxID=312471 RepID=A0A7S1MJY5_NEODS
METVVSVSTSEGPIAFEFGVGVDEAAVGIARGAFAGARVGRVVPEACIALEFSPRHLSLPTVPGDMYGAGTVACAERDDGSGVLIIGLCPLVDAKLRVVGRVREGMRTVAKIALSKTDDASQPITPITVNQVTCDQRPRVPRPGEVVAEQPKKPSKLLGQLFS